MTHHPGLVDARSALEHGEWQRAVAVLDGIDEHERSADALELLAQAHYGGGDFEASITAWEQLYELQLSEHHEVDAARAAAMLAMFLMIDTGLMAPVRGWVRRAERLLEQHPDTPPHALVATVRTYERFMSGDLAGARTQSAIAIELGARHGVIAAVVIGRVAAARLTIFEGNVNDGLEQLDEIATLLMSGEVDPLTSGMMYCELICAARGLALHDRAMEWTDIMERWRQGVAFGGLNGRCRVHRAEMFRISGPCDRAEEEALLACEELRPWLRREFGWPLVELGNIRLRKGDLDGAEAAFLAAHERTWSAQPGLALLRLAQGDVATAARMIDEEIAHPFDLPWKERPPLGELRLAPLLSAQSEVAMAAGNVVVAEKAATRLLAIADMYPSQSLRADALLAAARSSLLQGDLASCKSWAANAAALWAEIGAPFEAALARTVLAEARRLDGNADGARMEWQAARSVFREFGAHGWADRCDQAVTALNAGAEPSGTPPTTDLVAARFRRDGDVRDVALGTSRVTVHDMKGLRYIERLLANPGREFHVLDLVAGDQGTRATAAGTAADVGVDDDGSLGAAGLPVLDDRAREAYRRRLVEVEDDIDDATRMNDPARLALAERDREYLVLELQRAVGLGGALRTTGGNAERARTAVTRSVRYAVARLAEHHPIAATHFEQRIRTGTYCSYQPDPLAPVDWVV
jgi:tetratricopeptide (TPR) repeat protein